MKSAKVTDAKAGAQHYRRVMAAFDGALSLGRGERAAFLDRQCGGDAALRREVEAMLSQADSTHAPVEAGGGIQAVFRAGEAAAETTGLSATAPHLLAGQYRILRIIGEGGMGIVYEAEQALPRRIVALKAIRSAFASRQMLERFVQEAHILGRLHHPGIAQIYEAGAAVAERSDQAFFAMEFVDGPSLTEYAKRHGLPLGERVELLARVCDAVQHAHQRGVIHRDLKPSNILVDPSGQPKILDFGVARLAERDTDGLVSNTHAGQLVGTLPYMSPEQVGGDSNEVDTRSDVYALGVLLYELATGELPHPVGERTLPQMLLVIQREEAPRLSKKNRALAGDIESIAAMALAKEKSRRYASAAELGLDLRRFLEGDAVLAKRDSALYVLRKQIERHRTLTAAVAAAVIGLIAFAVYNEVRADREMRAKQTALSALDEADVQRRRADESAGQLAAALRSSNIERGRLMSASGDLRGAERVLWNEHLEHPTPSSHWALWDLYAHYPCTRAFGGDDTVLSLALSPDARSFATGSQDKLVRVWDLESGTPSTVFAGHGAAVIAVAYAPAARRLYSASMDGTIKAWDLDRRAEAWSLHVDGELSSMACARDGRRAAACCRDGRMRVVDLEHGRLTLEHRGPSGAMSAVCFGPDADTFVTGGGDAVLRVWNASTGELVRELGGEVESITGLCVSPDGHHLASGSRDGAVELRAWPTLEVEGRLKSDDGTLSSLAFDSAGRRLLATGSRRVEVWDVDRRARATDDAELDQPSFAAQFLADGRTIIAGSVGGPMRVWELDIRSIPSAIGPPFARDQVVALSHDGRWAAGGGKDNSISLLDMATETNVGVFRGHDAPLRTISFDAQGERLVSAGYDNTVKVWNVADRSCSFTLEKQAAFVNGVRFSPDGRTIGVGLMNGAVRLYDAATGVLAHTLDTSLGEAQRFAFSPDSARLATTYRGREIQVWDARSGEPRERLQAPDAAWSIAFVPRSDLLVVGAWNGALEVWDVGAKKLVRTMAGHGQVVNSLSIAGSAAIASAGADGCLRLWDADAGECLATFDARVGPAENVLLSDDGRALTGVFADGSLRRWDLAGFDRRIAGNADYQAARRAAEAASAEAARRGAAGR